MDFFAVLSEMIIILFAIAVGYAANRLGYLGGEVDKKLSKLVVNITMPAMILGSVATGEMLPGTAEILAVLKVAVIFYCLELLFAVFMPRFLGGTPSQKGVWRYALMFANVAFIGYPVVISLFGAEWLFYAVILVLPFNMLSYSLGPLMLAGAKRFQWKQLLSPCIVAAFIALIVALARIQLPAKLGELLNFVGDITVPVSLLIVGSLLAGLPVRQVFSSFRLWVLSAVRLLVLPVLMWLILRGMNIDPVVQGIAVIEMAMPVAINGSMLSMEYGGDTHAMAQITFLTTLISVVTIPLLAALLL